MDECGFIYLDLLAGPLLEFDLIKHQMLLHVILNFCHLFSVSSYCEVLPTVQSYCSKFGYV